MKKLLFLMMLVFICKQGFSMVYPVGDPSIKPTASFSSGNGYVITQQFLHVGVDGRSHMGVDLATYNNASGGDVRSITAGAVTYVQNSQGIAGWGTMIRIRHELPDRTYYSQYAHLLYGSITVVTGSTVSEGQIIGKVGNTGYSTNSHLHFEIKIVDNNGCGYLPHPNCSGDSMNNYCSPLEFIAQNQALVAHYPDNTTHHQILNCYNLQGGASKVGWPIDDGSGPFVHKWLPWHYDCQNFRNAEGQESIIMYGSLYCNQAYLIPGKVWGCYRYGYNGSFGPDILLPNNKRLGGPIGEYRNGIQYFENGFYASKINKMIGYKSLDSKSQPLGNSVSVELRQLDGTLIETYYPSGELSSLELSGKPISQNQVILAWIGGPVASCYDVFRNGQHINTVALPEFTETGLLAGNTYTYQVAALADDFTELARSNQVSLVMPGQTGSFLLQGMAEGSSYAYLQWQNSLYDTQFYWLYRDGVLVAKTTGSAFSDFPLEPNTTYTYQVAAVTFSGLVFGLSNPALVTTEPAPPEPVEPESTATTVQLHLPKTVWEYAETDILTATVYDQFGDEMPSVPVFFISSNYQIFSVSAENGWCIANNIGSTEIWAEIKDARWIKSERMTVTVVAQLPPEPVEPDFFDSAPLMLTQDLEISQNPPYVEWQQYLCFVEITNPTDQEITFWGPRNYTFNLNGNVVWDGSYSSQANTLQPNESRRYSMSGQFQTAGQYYTMAMISFTGSAYADLWYVIDQAAQGVSNKLYYTSLSQSDLKPDINIRYFEALKPEGQDSIFEGQNVRLYLMLMNEGHKDITEPFEVLVSLFGNGISQNKTIIIDGIQRGWPSHHYFDFGPLPAGNYKADCFADSENIVEEYSKTNNVRSTVIEVLNPPEPKLPDLTITSLLIEPSEARVGQTSTVKVEVSNIGDAKALACLLGLSFGSQYVELEVPPLEPGQSLLLSHFFSPAAEGQKQVSAVVDTDNVVVESYENNNSASITIQVMPMLLPDLIIIQFGSTKPEWLTTESPVLELTVQNQGQTSSSDCKLRLVCGSQTQNQSVPSLIGSQTHQLQFELESLPQGNWTVEAIVDFQDEVIEADEGNNMAQTILTVVEPPAIDLPDLVIDKASCNIYRLWNLRFAYFSTEVKNQGKAPASSFVLEVEISQTGRVYSKNISSLKANASSRLSFWIWFVPVNQLTFKIMADPNNQVQESDETNNYFELSRSF